MSIFKLAKILPMGHQSAYAHAFAKASEGIDQADPAALWAANKTAKAETTKYIASRNRNFKIGAGVALGAGLVGAAAHALKKKKDKK